MIEKLVKILVNRDIKLIIIVIESGSDCFWKIINKKLENEEII